MYKRIVLFFIFLGFACGAFAQETDTTKVEEPAEVPVISYSSPPKKYKIADIKVTGIKNYDDFVLIGFSGLSVGDEVTIPEPGGAITDAVKRFWKHGLFSDVKILATKIEGDQVWLEIQLKQRPRISEVNYHGIKKGEREDLEARLDSVHITANKNTVPGETRSPFVTSGVRLGTPAVTTRGMGVAEMKVIADCIADCIWHYDEKKDEISARVLKLTEEFPLYQ